MIDTEQAIIDTERKAGPNIRTLKACCASRSLKLTQTALSTSAPPMD